jgi:putative tryptophan/tyrosine transport system substrate-binding protein
MIRRRDLLTMIGSAAATLPLAARAEQSGKFWRIGMLETASKSANKANLDVFRGQLRRLGYQERQNITIEYRFPGGDIDRFPELAAELVRLNVDVIVTRGTPAVVAAKKVTATIPIVMAASADPVKLGVVASLARPGGNVTGFNSFVVELAAKRLEVVSQIIPGIKRVGCLDNMSNFSAAPLWEEVKVAASSLGIEPQLFDVRSPDEVDRAVDAASTQHVDALIVGNDTSFTANRRRVIKLAAEHRLPALYQDRGWVDAGGLVSYGVDLPELYRRAATYVDRIFKGEKPADLPVEQPTRLDLVINLKTAKVLGLRIPEGFLTRADEVIE